MKTATQKQYEQLTHMMGGQFGDSCQAIFYTLTQGTHGIVTAVSGTVTPVQIGDPLPDYFVPYVEEEKEEYGFINKNIPGLVLRTSVHFARGVDGKVSGLFCIHHNILHIQMISSFLDELTRPTSREDDDTNDYSLPSQGEAATYQAANIQEFADKVLEDYLVNEMGVQDFTNLDKDGRLKVIAELERKGIFMVKGSVNAMAQRLNVSKFTIYNYLDEVRASQ